MVPAIVPVYAAVLAFIYIVLSVRVIRARRNAKVAIGTKGNAHLERKIRVHANFAEYVPLALLLATFIENFGLRTAGMAATFGVLAVMALSLLTRASGLSWP